MLVESMADNATKLEVGFVEEHDLFGKSCLALIQALDDDFRDHGIDLG